MTIRQNLLIGLLFASSAAFAQSPVMNGIDVLKAEHYATLKRLAANHNGHLRIGIVTNQIGVDLEGNRTIDLLAKDAAAAVPGVSLNAIFSPEHGINGVLDRPGIADDKDAATGLSVTSLFGEGEASRHPRPEQLKDLDAIVVDLQEAGVRYWTFDTLMTYMVKATAKLGMEIMVLDRPNPVNGVDVQGPLSEPGRENYINAIVEPVRTGLTMGELAKYIDGEDGVHARLTVIKMQGWHRGDWWDATGLEWNTPSPNLRNLNEATLYPGIGLLEGSNLNVGRGTDTPFEWIGASWIDGRKLAAYLNARSIAGVRLVPVRFTPAATTRYPYHGEVCQGVYFLVTDRKVLNSPALGIEVASALYRLFPDHYEVDKVDRLMLNKHVVSQIKSGVDPRTIEKETEASLAAYKARRAKYLLY